MRKGPLSAGSLRVSDAEREQVAARVRDAATVGMLPLAEADERQAAAYAAQIRADLAELTDDLPAVPVEPGRSVPLQPQVRRRLATKAQLSGRPRKFVRATHVTVSAGWLGLVVAMLTLGISAATASHPTSPWGKIKRWQRSAVPQREPAGVIGQH